MQKNTYELKKGIYWVGVNDYELRVFDIIMRTEFGSSYNAYLVKGNDKVALIDTVKANFSADYLAKVGSLVDFSAIDYLIVNHTEPDHSGSIADILDKNPDITIVGSAPSLSNLKEILNRPFKSLRATPDLTIDLGNKTLKFMIRPNLHWPDTIFTYVPEDGILFTCDFFGAHYAFEGVLAKNVPDRKDFAKAFKEYFDAIMSPFRPFVLKGIEGLEELNLEYIATSHGAVLDETFIKEALHKYAEWAKKPEPREKPFVVIAFASAYGYTARMAEVIAKAINFEFGGKIDIETYDVVTTDIETIVGRIGESDGFLIGTTTILRDAVYPIWDMLSRLNPEIDGGKTAGAFGSYGWSGEAVQNVTERLKQLKMKTVDGLRIRFKPSDSQIQTAYDFGIGFAKKLKE